MKMVKSLLLGSAAGVVAMAGAQAADLPVKAKPVQYVKICSLYGAGFYYIPGTDMCLKMGGWVRAEYTWGGNGSLTWGPYNNNVNNRSTNNSAWRERGYITADARNQTEYGTVRSYIAVGVNANDTGAGNVFSANRAFIQFAGFTFGLSQSFFDFYSVPATALWGSYPASDTGDPGWLVLGYTAQFGNGLSASLAAEMRRQGMIINQNGASSQVNAATATAGAGYGGFNAPDIVANLRVDQKWGSAQIMAALHEVNALYYSTSALENSGHPSDEWGFVLGVGGKFFVPMVGAGDYLQFQVNYTEGALRYLFNTPQSHWYYQEGQSAGYGNLSDGIFGGTITGGNASSIELTTGWSVNAAYEHYWNKQWKTSVYGGYAEVNYNSAANAMLCSLQGKGSGSGTTAVANPGCDNDWNTWWIGSRTQWNISPDTYLAVDILYQNLNSASPGGSGLVPTAVIPSSTATTGQVASDKDNVAARFRVHKDFYP